MCSVVIAEVHEVLVSDRAFVVGVPVADVGPFLEQDAVVSLNLAVGLGTVGPGVFRGEPELGQAGPPHVALVRRSVVGDHPLDGDADVVEPGVGSNPEPDGCDGLFI